MYTFEKLSSEKEKSEDPYIKLFWDNLNVSSYKFQHKHNVINDFSDFTKKMQKLLISIRDSIIDLLDKKIDLYIRGSRITGKWYENHEILGNSDYDFIINGATNNDLQKIQSLLPKLENKYSIKIDRNLLGNIENSILIE